MAAVSPCVRVVVVWGSSVGMRGPSTRDLLPGVSVGGVVTRTGVRFWTGPPCSTAQDRRSMAASRPLFVVNPSAGNGRATRAMARARPAFCGPAEEVETTGPGEAELLAHQGAVEGFSPIVSVGGDGTAHEVVNGLMRSPSPPSLAIVPAGSGNDAARTLRLPGDPVEAVRLVWSDRQGAIDLGTCSGRYFLNVAGVGLDTKVARAVNRRASRLSRSRAGYIWQALLELRRYENPEFVIHLDDQVVRSRCLLIAAANLRYFAGGMKICPRADPVDGWLDVCIGGDLS